MMNRIALLAAVMASLPALSGTAQAQGSLEAGKEKAAVCAACHGPDGNVVPGTAPDFACTVTVAPACVTSNDGDPPVTAKRSAPI